MQENQTPGNIKLIATHMGPYLFTETDKTKRERSRHKFSKVEYTEQNM